MLFHNLYWKTLTPGQHGDNPVQVIDSVSAYKMEELAYNHMMTADENMGIIRFYRCDYQ